MNVKVIVVDSENIRILEKQIRKSLNYFQLLRRRQLDSRENGDENWAKTFLDTGKTWTNIRKTCKGFIEYCRASIEYAKTHSEKLPSFHGVSVAHSNSSVLEAWFSLIRNMNLDSATTYESGVGNKLMQNACSLQRNRMYSVCQAGEIASEKGLGPSEIIKFHADCDKQMDECLESNYYSKLGVFAKEPIPVFLNSAVTTTGMKPFEADMITNLIGKKLNTCFVETLLGEDYFKQWVRLSHSGRRKQRSEQIRGLGDLQLGSALSKITGGTQNTSVGAMPPRRSRRCVPEQLL